ncbi:E3 ubiquitin-protein ligase DTX3L-like [Styela clava]
MEIKALKGLLLRKSLNIEAICAGVSYEAQEFTEYLPWNDGWICLNLLRQAFDAGLIFKIQEVGDRRGKIAWNDEFPHKTNKTGGPGNNGYPDPDHTMKLKEAFKAKGFEYDGRSLRELFGRS